MKILPFFLIQIVWIIIVFFSVPITKTQVLFLDLNPVYITSLFIFYFLALFYLSSLNKKKSIFIFLIISIAFALFYYLSTNINNYILLTLADNSNIKWVYKIRWMDIPLAFSLTIFLTRILKSKKQFNQIMLALILILSFFQACKKENAIYNRTMDESQEERVIGIQGVISKIEIITEEYKNGKNTKINHYHTLKISLNTGSQLTAFEDSSKKRIADIPELNSIYEKEKFSELPFEKDSPLIEKLNEFRQFKPGDSIIIRIPY